MSLNPLGLGIPRLPARDGVTIERVIVQRPLDRVLAFLGRDIHDVVNCPVVKRQVYGYFKLSKEVQRTCETVDLERSWNPLNMRY